MIILIYLKLLNNNLNQFKQLINKIKQKLV